MNQKYPRRGFALVELLVVLVIIGILAAIAVPQYQKALERSKSGPIFSLVKAIGTAGEAYYLEHGSYPTQFSQLDVNLPKLPGTKAAISGAGTEARSNEDVSFQIISSAGSKQYGVWATRLRGKYKGGVILYWWYDPSGLPLHQVMCAERKINDTKFTGDKGEFCQKLFQGTFLWGTYNNYFRLP